MDEGQRSAGPAVSCAPLPSSGPAPHPPEGSRSDGPPGSSSSQEGQPELLAELLEDPATLERCRAMRAAQGLPPTVEDPTALALMARWLGG